MTKAKYKACEVCSKKFYANYPSRRFCSKGCRLKSGWVDKDPSKKTIFVCDWCKKEFETWTYRQPRFCSRQCTSEFAARQPRPTTRKPEIHITRTCKTCSKEYKTTTHQVRERGSNYCSRECQYKGLSMNRRGENNPHWTGGSVDPNAYGPNWGTQKRKAKKRDSHTCQNCGYKSGGNQFLDVHHTIPIKEFNGDWEKANQLSNLVCLCRSCHAKVESSIIPPTSRQGIALE